MANGPITKALGAVFILVFGIVLLAPMLSTVLDDVETTRTSDTSETGLNCTTGSGETSCTVSLADEHAYPSNDYMTVTETDPGSGDRTSSTSVGSDTSQLTVSGLSESTTYTFDIDYRIVDPSVFSGLDAFLRSIGLLIVVGFVVLVGLILLVSMARGRTA